MKILRAILFLLVAVFVLHLFARARAWEPQPECPSGFIWDDENQRMVCYEDPTRQATGCRLTRDHRGRIVRSKNAIHEFQRRTVCPSSHKRGIQSCNGYVIDHVWPLCAGGCDVYENMQYQEAKAAKAKDKLELKLCALPEK